MAIDLKRPLTWPQLVTDLEQLWRKPAAEFLPDLLGHIRHDVLAMIEPVLVGSKMLVSFYTLSPDQQARLQHCGQTADEWLLNCRLASDACLARGLDMSATCECFVQALGSIFANSTDEIRSLAAIENTEDLEPEAQDVIATIDKGLRRLERIVIGYANKDLSWLKEAFEEQERKRNRKL
jgi:hypothetical protein